MEEYSYYEHLAVQREVSGTHVLAAENKLMVFVTNYKARGVKAVIDEHDLEEDDNFEVESNTQVAETYFYADFSRIKQFSSDPSVQSEYTNALLEALSHVGIPGWRHEAILESFFLAVDTAVSPDKPLDVAVWDATIRRWDPYQDADYKPISVGAARSLISELEEMQHQVSIPLTDSCPICLAGFVAPQERPITRLPCPAAHHYHLECVLRWLQVSHVCPMCRFPMPTEQ